MSPAEERLSSMQGSTKRRTSVRKRRLSEKFSDQMDHDTSDSPAQPKHVESAMVDDRLTHAAYNPSSKERVPTNVHAPRRISRRRGRLAKIALMVSLLHSSYLAAGKALFCETAYSLSEKSGCWSFTTLTQ